MVLELLRLLIFMAAAMDILPMPRIPIAGYGTKEGSESAKMQKGSRSFLFCLFQGILLIGHFRDRLESEEEQ